MCVLYMPALVQCTLECRLNCWPPFGRVSRPLFKLLLLVTRRRDVLCALGNSVGANQV